MNAREEVLARIRVALTDRPAPGRVPRGYRPAGTVTASLQLFANRLIDYHATVMHAELGSVARMIAGALKAGGIRRVVVPAGFPAEWLPAIGAELVRDDPPLTAAELDAADGVVTTCAVAIAETGTIILDGGPGQGRRALTLIPDYHLVLVRADDLCALVPDAIAALDPCRPQTWISGPSATSDIELSRVEGVHGPRTLVVLVVSSDGSE